MSAEKPTNGQTSLLRLLDVMEKLRDPDTGCPWDVQQTMTSLTRYTIEEAYEVADAIESGQDKLEIKSELGDLLFQIVFYAQIAREENAFDFFDVCDAISDKLIRRHPHVFEDGDRNADLSAQWEAIKRQEKRGKDAPQSVLDDVTPGLPSLSFATKLQKKAATIGFDWPDVSGVLDKVSEELGEIDDALEEHGVGHKRVEEEIGDALFALVNLSRHAKVDADTSLRKASIKFAKRFKSMEQTAKRNNEDMTAMSIDELEARWQQAKKAQ